MAVAGAIITGFVIGTAMVAPWLAPHDPFRHDLDAQLVAPGTRAPFGTDQYGRDVLSRVLLGSRYSLAVGLTSVAVACLAGTVLGLVSGSSGGWTDHALVRLVDLLLAFPTVVVAILLVGLLGRSMASIVLALAIPMAPRVARVIRGEVLAVRGRDFVHAAYALGADRFRMMYRHILPHVVSPLVVLTTLYFPQAILVESSLSFLGIGVSPDTPTWGRIIADGREYLQSAPWVSLFPGAAITLTSIGFNLFGDGLRDALDPRLRTRV